MSKKTSRSIRNKEFFELYGQSQNRILSFLFVMVHNEADAEDILQDTAATMLEKFDTFEPGTNFTAWGIIIAKNKALNFIRKNAKMRPLFHNSFYTHVAELETREDERYSDRDAALDKCLKQLEESDQKILQMRYQQELPMNKISELLGRSKTGIYHTLARIHSVLHRCIQVSMAKAQV